MRTISLILILLGSSATARCCVTCNRQIQEAIFSSSFYPNLLTMLSAFIVLAIIIGVLFRLATRRYVKGADQENGAKSPVPLATAGLVLGIGAGGFIDGIVLHQLLQWHEMLSAKMPPDTLVFKSVNMFWDGIFHCFTLLTTLIGIYLLWKVTGRREADHSGLLLLGGMIAGWGLFNVVEGLIDHQILGLHNVREQSMNQQAWNYGFLLLGIAQLLAGLLLMRKRFSRPPLQGAGASVTEHS